MKELMKKIPWGIIAGICGVVAFYTIAGTIAAFYIMNAITSIVEGAAGLFGTSWQTLLFVCDIIFGVIFVASLVMFILTKATKLFNEEVPENA